MFVPSNEILVSIRPRVDGARWSFRRHVAIEAKQGPYLTSCKHTTLLYVPEERRIFQMGGDYGAPPRRSNNGTFWDYANNRREAHSASIDDGAELHWRLEQPMFTPSGQCAGPWWGTDQVWFWRRTAVNPPEFWVGPGFYRSDMGIPKVTALGEDSGTPDVAFKWLRPGWEKPATQRRKVASNVYSDPALHFKRWFGTSSEPDKFCAYDPVSDAAYCINDMFEVIKWDHADGDWDHVPSGDQYTALHMKAVDDRGRAIYGASIISIGGGFQARVGRRIYALGMLWYPKLSEMRNYLCWFDIDAATVGAITCPFTIDANFMAWGPDGKSIYAGNPEEHTFMVALDGTLVIAVGTHFGIDPAQDEPWLMIPRPNATPDEQASAYTYRAGNRPIWTFDPNTGKWENGEPVPQWICGNSMVAIPDIGSVALMGSTAHTTGYTNPPPAAFYMVK